MTWRRWVYTAVSFAAVIGVSVFFILRWWRAGSAIGLPLQAHLLAIVAVLVEILTRSWKITWSAKAAHIELEFFTALRTTLAGDFGASITPARSGAEPARFLVLAEAGVPTSSALVVLFAELFLEALSLATVVIVVAIVFRHAGVVLGALVGIVGTYAGFVLGIAAIAMAMARKPVREVAPRWARRVGLGGRRWLVIERWLEQVRTTVDSVRHIDFRWAFGSYTMSVIHVAMRLCVLPALVLGAGAVAPLAPLALWPLGLLYGAAVVPAPGGGGAVELAFRAALAGVIGKSLFAAALLWWRFYTFYIYIVLGAIVAGNTAMRAVRKTAEMEEELEVPE
ncbi:MAG TPA: lysylphosphatidylglycerol synthase transmembrane domain-containing protein [Gemmatimonadaceae bacterium]|jgi:glycosyltransferase 2 family protein|nr:lysylphosphatidylglycerol synthase transmembrane domain-containing protein [Gemmatimonadaceae bacterium]